MSKLYALFARRKSAKRGARWIRISALALPKDKATLVFRGYGFHITMMTPYHTELRPTTVEEVPEATDQLHRLLKECRGG